MAFARPEFSRSQVSKAGSTLANPQDASINEYFDAFLILNNWRSCHSYPINTFQKTLRDKVRPVDHDAIIAQRLKRTPSILAKLQRFPNMKLSTMQDIGGLRAVVKDIRRVEKLRDSYIHPGSSFKHELVSERNYIQAPKDSGYRSIHLVFRYKNSRNQVYDGLQIELQLRTRLQHLWATAVETVGTFLQQPLKSSQGPADWLHFFSLASSAFAQIEQTPPVPGYLQLTKQATFIKTIETADLLKIREQLAAFTVAASEIRSEYSSGHSYHLVVLNATSRSVEISSFSREESEKANLAYTEAEKRITGNKDLQAVLVSAGPIESLRRAYPNFFLDTQEFIEQLNKIEEAVRS